jgi:exosortase
MIANLQELQAVSKPQSISRYTGLGTFAVLGVVVLYWCQLFYQLQIEWSANAQYSYGWFVPVLAAMVLWRRWGETSGHSLKSKVQSPKSKVQSSQSEVQSLSSKVLGPESEVWGWVSWLTHPAVFVLLLCLLLPLRIIHEANVGWRSAQWLHAVILVVLTLMLLWRAGGWRWVRHFGFPVVFLLVAVPWPSRFEDYVVQGLMRLVAAVTVEVVGLFGVPAMQRGNLLEIGSGVVSVDGACSGVRSLQTSLMMALFLGELYRLRYWWRLALVPASLLIAFATNVGRTSFLTWSAARLGMARMESLHDSAGLAVVIIVFGLLWLSARLLAHYSHSAVGPLSIQDSESKDQGPKSKVQSPGLDVGCSMLDVGCSKSDNPPVPPEVQSPGLDVGSSVLDVGCSKSDAPPSPLPAPPSIGSGLDVGSSMLDVGCSKSGSPPTPNYQLLTINSKFLFASLAWLLCIETATAVWFHLGDKRAQTNPAWSVTWPTAASDYQEAKLSKLEFDTLRYDTAKNVAWQDEAGNRWGFIALRWGPDNKNSFIGRGHTPDICFTGAGWKLVSEPAPVRVPVNGLELPFRRYLFEVGGKTAYVFLALWEERSPGGRQETPFAHGLSQRLKAAMQGNRHQGLKKLEISVIGPNSAEEALEVLQRGLEKLVTTATAEGGKLRPET